jgi:two-component system, sensor histidine kinase and response regulator
MTEPTGFEERRVLERLGVAMQAAGLECWEVAYAPERLIWYAGLPVEAQAAGAELEKRYAEVMAAILPEDNAAARAAMQRALDAGEDGLSTVVRLRESQGSIRHLRLYQRFFRDGNGKLLRLIGAARDITAEVTSAEDLRIRTALLEETQRRLEQASLSIQEGHWTADLPARRHWASRGYLALLGYSADSLEFDTLDKVKSAIHPSDLEMLEVATQRHFAGGSPYDVEIRFRMRDGSYRWFRLRGQAQVGDDGTPLTISGSMSEISKQRVAEEALREAQARFARAIHGTQDGLWEIDAVTERVWFSPRLSALLGFADGELGERAGVLRARAHPDDHTSMEAAIRVATEYAAPMDLEVRLKTKAGEYRWFRLRGTSASDAAGRVQRISGSMQDVTDAHGARDELIQATEAANAANRAKTEFLANVSHEIRTPMNGIIGMTRLLLDTALDATQRDYAETIRTSADSLLTIINDILDFSKIEAGKLDIESLEMDLPGNVEEVGTVMAFQAAAKNIELIVNVHPDVPTYVLGDPQRIRQCLINLIGNAIKFTRSGEIVCEVSVVAAPGERASLRFSVRDTGIGIAAGSLKSLFEPFVQADSSTTRHFGGTGLGLSIVRRLVQMMGGETGVASELGKGSTFSFVLPMTVVQSKPEPAQPPIGSAGRRILVVDDSETNRRVLLTQLSHSGYDVTLASGGKEALATMRSATAAARQFDLALVDFQMPDMDGAMLGEQINSDPHLARTRIVLLTSMDRHGDVGRFAAMGFAGYLSKPVRPRELLACLERVLSRYAEEWHAQTHPIITLGVAQQSPRAPLAGKVLLVEDNAVNQKVARRFLERMGCEVTVAENGLEGVRAFENGTFRLVLMDVQMPFMDGYAATQRIRSLEKGRSHTPIVALTANAMTDQLERCLDVGMDALLTKPLNAEHLEDILVRFGLAANDAKARTAAPAAGGAASPPAVDLAALTELTGGDLRFVAELARSYLDNGRELFVQMRACLARDERSELARTAHQLAGASASVHAAPLCELCLALEHAARTAGIADLEQAMADIGIELARVGERLTEVAAS